MSPEWYLAVLLDIPGPPYLHSWPFGPSREDQYLTPWIYGPQGPGSDPSKYPIWDPILDPLRIPHFGPLRIPPGPSGPLPDTPKGPRPLYYKMDNSVQNRSKPVQTRNMSQIG